MKTYIPEGFTFSSVSAGIKYKDRDDLALIFSETGASVCGVFTKNRVKAAPVVYSKEMLEKNRNKFNAILINSGNANACTGDKGLKDCFTLSEKLSQNLNVESRNILLASTGVIGVTLPVGKISDKFPELIRSLKKESVHKVASAIMTTDTFPKIFSIKDDFTICGIAKGAGMINPDMATMLCFILTDADIEKDKLKSMLSDITEKTFNSICVDGDTSTNDSVFLMSSSVIKDVDYDKFYNNLYNVMLALAKMIVKDGEGATKLIKITVAGGTSLLQCKNICKALSKSLLVKTAFFGNDPNWGRIICAVGYSDKNVIPEKIDIFYDKYQIVKNGMEDKSFSEKEIVRYLEKNNEINLKIDLKLGDFSYDYYTCDLSYEYVKINAEYRT